jgi:hypothetical protein
MGNGRKLRATVACGAILTIAAASAAGGVTLSRRARVAAAYTAAQQQNNGSFIAFSTIGTTADAVLGFVAVRRGPTQIDEAVSFLRRKVKNTNEVDTIGEKGKVVMALVAAGRNPRTFGGRNLVAEIRQNREADGSYSNLAFQEVFDQVLAMLGLAAAEAPVPEAAFDWLKEAQCPDGGWQFDQPYNAVTDNNHCENGEQFDSRSDSNTTAYAVQVLVRELHLEDLAYKPFGYLRDARDDIKKGYVFDAQAKCESKEPPDTGFCMFTDTGSTALVIQAYIAAQRGLPDGVMRALRRLQYRLCGDDGGAFASTYTYDPPGLKKGDPDVGATIAAMPALMKRPFPLEPADVSNPVPDVGAC